MISFLIPSLITVAVFNLALGVIVLTGRRNISHGLFFAFSLSIFFWVLGLALFLSATTPAWAFFWARIFYSSAAFIAYSLLMFAYVFPVEIKRKSLVLVLGAAPLLLVVVMVNLPEGLVQNVVLNNAGNEVSLMPLYYSLYSIYFLVYFYGAIGTIFYKLRAAWSTQNNVKKQLLYVFAGLLFAGTFGIFFNLILPLIGNYRLIWVGPQFSIVLVALIFIAIIRHKLFDTRLIIARTVAYILLLVTLTIIYSATVFSAISLLFGVQSTSPEQGAVYTIMAVLLAFSAMPLKKFFDRFTDKIFFHLGYSVEDVLNRLGDSVANEIDLKRVVNSSLAILSSALKPNFISIHILPTSSMDSGYRFSIGEDSLKPPSTESIINKLKRRDALIVVDYLEDEGLKKELNKLNVHMVMRLDTSRELVGYLFFGPKQSGGTYNSKDAQMLRTCRSELALAIQNGLRFLKIQNFNQTLQKEIEQATAELRESNKKLKLLDVAKDEFISMASHQLRTPLTSIKGFLSMAIEKEQAGNLTKLQRMYLDEAYASALRMAYLIADFLNISRLQTGKFSVEPSRTKLDDIVKEEVEQLRASAKPRNITIACHLPHDFPVMMIDDSKIRQVVMNLIDNAIFYSKAGDTITVDLIKTAKDIQLTVQDHGIGVPAAERHKLFTKFYRASNARRVRPDGTGVGLFVAKKVITEHGGTLIFKSEEGKGSTFGFTLPLSLAVTSVEKEDARHLRTQRAN